MSDGSSPENPYQPSGGNIYAVPPDQTPPQGMTTGDWLLCIFCSGIGCIVGIVRLAQGKPDAGKMIGVSILFAILWNIIAGALTSGAP